MTELERQLQLRALFERQAIPRIARVIIRQVNSVAARVAAGDGVEVALRSLETHSDDLRDVIEAGVKRTATAFAEHTWKVFEAALKSEFDALNWQPGDEHSDRWMALFDRLHGVASPFGGGKIEWTSTAWYVERKDRESVFHRARDAFAEQYAADEVVQINETTRDKIRRVVVEALKDQLGVRQIAKRVIEHVNGIANMTARARAQTIGRTETHNASNFGADEAAKATGLRYEREWLSAEDSRTRIAHADAHGQRRGPDEQFNVGGYSMYRPGLGPAAQTINCRCTLAFHPQPFGGSRRKFTQICE